MAEEVVKRYLGHQVATVGLKEKMWARRKDGPNHFQDFAK
jgi:hypothetical protein